MESKNLHVGEIRVPSRRRLFDATCRVKGAHIRSLPVRRWIAAWLPPAVWAAGLFFASLLPGSSIPTVEIPAYDKIVHAALYMGLGALCFRALQRTTTLRPFRAALLAAGIAAAYGVTDEVHQLWTPTRLADWRDALADAVGGLLGSFLFLGIASRRARDRGSRDPGSRDGGSRDGGHPPVPDPLPREDSSNPEAAL
jgi:VanZ family protein